MADIIYVGVLYVIVSTIIGFTVPAWKKFVNLFAGIMVLVALSPVFTFFGRLGDDTHEFVSYTTGAKRGLESVNNSIKDTTSTISNSPIVNYGAMPKLPGKTFIEKFTGGKLKYPLNGRITQGYNSNNHGLDIAGNSDTDPIKAARDGTVHEVGSNHEIWGNYIIIDHENTFQTLYAHLSEIKVIKNQHVWEGDIIGIVGNTGKSTGIHLHFGLYYSGQPIDPTKYMKK